MLDLPIMNTYTACIMKAHCTYNKLTQDTVASFDVNFILSEKPVRIVVFVYPDSFGKFCYTYVVESDIEYDLYGASAKGGHKCLDDAINAAQREIINSLPENMQNCMRSAMFNK